MSTQSFISFEGGEGSGKSTQATILRDKLVVEGLAATLVQEPGSTPLGSYLRTYLKSGRPISKEAELLLFEAARAELVVTLVRQHLANGSTVIADRFEASSIAYQGYGRKIDLEVIKDLNEFATGGLHPDITFLLDLKPEEGLRRVGDPQLKLPFDSENQASLSRLDVQGHRKFEDMSLSFHTNVRNGYLGLARDNPGRWIIIDADNDEEVISREIWRHVVERLSLEKLNP